MSYSGLHSSENSESRTLDRLRCSTKIASASKSCDSEGKVIPEENFKENLELQFKPLPEETLKASIEESIKGLQEDDPKTGAQTPCPDSKIISGFNPVAGFSGLLSTPETKEIPAAFGSSSEEKIQKKGKFGLCDINMLAVEDLPQKNLCLKKGFARISLEIAQSENKPPVNNIERISLGRQYKTMESFGTQGESLQVIVEGSSRSIEKPGMSFHPTSSKIDSFMSTEPKIAERRTGVEGPLPGTRSFSSSVKGSPITCKTPQLSKIRPKVSSNPRSKENHPSHNILGAKAFTEKVCEAQGLDPHTKFIAGLKKFSRSPIAKSFSFKCCLN